MWKKTFYGLSITFSSVFHEQIISKKAPIAIKNEEKKVERWGEWQLGIEYISKVPSFYAFS
jgi:hypothetical protein